MSDFIQGTLCINRPQETKTAQGPALKIRPCAPASHEGVPNPVAVGKICVGEIPKCWISYRENAIRAKQTTWDIPENTLHLRIGQGSPSGLRPPVNP